MHRRLHHRTWGKVRASSQPLPSLIKPGMQFSRTRPSDVLHTQACADFQPAAVGTL